MEMLFTLFPLLITCQGESSSIPLVLKYKKRAKEIGIQHKDAGLYSKAGWEDTGHCGKLGSAVTTLLRVTNCNVPKVEAPRWCACVIKI